MIHLMLMFFGATVTIITSISHVCHQNPIFFNCSKSFATNWQLDLFAHNNPELVLQNVLLNEKKKLQEWSHVMKEICLCFNLGGDGGNGNSLNA